MTTTTNENIRYADKWEYHIKQLRQFATTLESDTDMQEVWECTESLLDIWQSEVTKRFVSDMDKQDLIEREQYYLNLRKNGA